MYGGGYDNYQGGGDNYQGGGEMYGQMQMQDQNFGGYNGGQMGGPYQQMGMQQPGMGGFGYDANGFPAQPMMYDPYGYQQQPYQGEMDPYAAGQDAAGGEYDAQQTEAPVAQSYNDTNDESDKRASPDMRRKKSFTGPPEGSNGLSKSRSAKAGTSTRKGGEKSGGLARNGSVFQMNRERDTQRSVSTRGGFQSSSREVGEEQLEEYYGDMAKRYGEQRFDGFKAVKSYRGEIQEGQDVGKPRRVTGARGLQGKGSTGYGGLNYKRQCAMRNGESWGDIEVRRKANSDNAAPMKSRALNLGDDGDDDDEMERQRRAMEEERRRREMEEYMRRMREAELAAAMQQQMMMAAMMDQPAVPHVFNQEDVHSYSNLSDAFADDQVQDEEDFYDESAQ